MSINKTCQVNLMNYKYNICYNNIKIITLQDNYREHNNNILVFEKDEFCPYKIMQ